MKNKIVNLLKKVSIFRELKYLFSTLIIILLVIYKNYKFIHKHPKNMNFNIFREITEEVKLFQSNKFFFSNFLLYNFIYNITKNNYYGEWEFLNIKNNIFENKKGNIEIIFMNSSSNLMDFLTNNYSITIDFNFKDGKYIDNELKGNITFTLEKEFNNNLEDTIFYNKNINIILDNIKFNYHFEELFEVYKELNYTNNIVNIIFINEEKIFSNNINYEKDSSLFSKVHISIKNKYSDFEFKCYGEMKNNKDNYSKSISNYSNIFFLYGFLQILINITFFTKININFHSLSVNTSLLTLFMQIVWTCLITTINLILLLIKDEKFELGIVFLIYFFLTNLQIRNTISTFEYIIYFNYAREDNFDFNVYLNHMQIYTILFFLCLFLFLTFIQVFFIYTFMNTIIFFIFTWLGQIFVCAYHNVKPPMNLTYIYLFSFIQISTIIYFKGYPYNILYLKPSYIKVTIICVILIIETLILTFQEIIDPKFFIPESLKENNGMQFKYNSQLSEEQKENICSICLFTINESPYSENENLKTTNNNVNDIKKDDERKIIFEDIKLKLIKYFKKPIIITQCKHIFHSICLEKYLKSKNKCPICRRKIQK
jgi:hypothetical protein